MSRSNAHFQHWCETAGETAETWAVSPAAQALLAKVIMLEQLADSVTGFDSITDAIGDTLCDLECELDNARTDAINEAGAQHPGEFDEYLADELDEAAPNVTSAISAYRATARQTALDECFPPVRWIAPGIVAA
jgi:hypothetical protein